MRRTHIRRGIHCSAVLPATVIMMCIIISKNISNIYICLTVQCLNINLIPESGNVKAMVLRVMAEHGAVDGASGLWLLLQYLYIDVRLSV